MGTAALAFTSPWWSPATAISAFAAGQRPGRSRSAAGALLATVVGGVAAVCAVPSWITFGDRFVTVLAGAAVLPWCTGRFWRQYRALVRAGWERAAHLEREQRRAQRRRRKEHPGAGAVLRIGCHAVRR